ncbi:DUF6785 family protein [Candidatus Poribacteria bacterium]
MPQAMGKGLADPSITFRACLIGFSLVPINVYLVVQMESVWGMQYPTTMALLFNVIFCLLILIFSNLLLRKLLPGKALTQGELLTIYIILSMATVISGHDTIQTLICHLGHPFWFATPENEWKELFFRYIPRWLAVDNKKVLEGYYEGHSTFLETERIKAWLSPVLWWSAFTIIMSFIMLFVNVILRKQWIRREKLTYPIIQLPFEITKDGGSWKFLSNRLFLIGFAVASLIDIINGLNYLYPAVPFLNIRYEVGKYFTEKPLSAMGQTPVQFNPFAIGLGFLIPLDLSFSCWFFYLFWKAQLILGSAIGTTALPGFPYMDIQRLGGFIAIGIVALFMSRRYIWQVFLRAIARKSEVHDEDEPMRYRTALIGFTISSSLLITFCYMAGMSILAILSFFGIYFIVLMAFTRIRAELGPPVLAIFGTGPELLITNVIGTRSISPKDLTMFSLLHGISRNYRSKPMPDQLEAFKLAEEANIDSKKLVYVMMTSIAFGTVLCFSFFLHAGYRWGSLGIWRGEQAFSRLQTWLSYPHPPDYPSTVFAGVGFIFVIMMMALRLRFLWWPIHPIAYPLASVWEFKFIWFPIFISWAIKYIILKYGGLHSYRKAIPFFLGLVIGEFFVAGFWGIFGLLTQTKTYAFKYW